MGFFAAVRRRPGDVRPWQGGGLAGPVDHGSDTSGQEVGTSGTWSVPPAFAAVAEALTSGSDPGTACDVVGRELARDGADLGEALRGLRSTWRAVRSADPDFGAVEALATSWSEATLGYLHQMSCEDPLTGLASAPHLRARLAEIYRESTRTGLLSPRGSSVTSSFALVVVEIRPRPVSATGRRTFDHALEVSRVAADTRSAFSGGETLSRVGDSRLAVLVRRHDGLGRQVAALHDLLHQHDPSRPPRVWIEGLPRSEPNAARLLDELTRA